VAAENAPNRGFSPFAARFIRSNQIRSHDEMGRTTWNSAITIEQVDNQTLSSDKALNSGVGFRLAEV
jgi:hypothetical protein